ncbi:MAG: 30S ribosomal protein S9, partial [Candidatus Omnitrophota bacterium]
MEKIVEYVTVGRRKESVARVRLRPGTGKFKLNKRGLEDYFPRETHRIMVMIPMNLTGTANKYDVIATLSGGGSTGQAGA